MTSLLLSLSDTEDKDTFTQKSEISELVFCNPGIVQ